MAKYDINLRPIHYASVSGGKDSLYMLNMILNMTEKYPLEMVVHFQLEIDWGWAERVIDFMEERCKQAGIKFLRIKPRTSYWDLFKKYGFPTRVARWCNSDYKMDSARQLNEWIVSQNCRPVAYIGLCADETKRFKYEVGGGWEHQDICYPLAEEGIKEDTILEWAKQVPIFEGWYKHFRRQSCMLCPMITLKELAYMSKYENEKYQLYLNCLRDSEQTYAKKYNNRKVYKGDLTVDELEERVKTKWLPILDLEENQLTIFDFAEIEGE